jgi:hypothetical protein
VGHGTYARRYRCNPRSDEGEMSLLIEQLEAGDELEESEAQRRFSEIKASGVWEAMYTLADAIDRR